MTIQIDNSEIENFFINEFKSDVKKFSEFILLSIKKYKKQNEFNITPLNSKENSYRLKFDDLEEIKEEDNYIGNASDVVAYAKKLRENSCR